ncbi:MAG: hypothetical protein K5871_07505 [Lachnospiraceae bacterium]|nr:hypothetical protein [Lachnospiraceae bacterium]
MDKTIGKNQLNIRLLFVHLSFWGFILGLPVLYMILGPRIDTVNYENRNLAEKPVFSVSDIDSYPSDYEDYYNDNFPFRSKLITLNSRISYQVFGEGIGSAIVGRDGWLFYNADLIGDGRTLEQFKGARLFTEEELQSAAASLEATAEWCAEHDCEFVLMIAPNKERMYAEFMPESYQSSRVSSYCGTDQLVDYLRDNTDIRVVWAYEDLAEYKEMHPERPLYYRLDTHWNQLGGYIGSRALLRELGIDVPSADEKVTHEQELEIGDLTMIMNLGASDLFSDTDYSFEGYPAAGMQINSYDPAGIIMYSMPDADPRNVMIYRDSFCLNMNLFLGEHFARISMIAKDCWDPALLEADHPDVLVYELTERFVENLVDEHIQP